MVKGGRSDNGRQRSVMAQPPRRAMRTTEWTRRSLIEVLRLLLHVRKHLQPNLHPASNPPPRPPCLGQKLPPPLRNHKTQMLRRRRCLRSLPDRPSPSARSLTWICNHRTTLPRCRRMVLRSTSPSCLEPLANPIATTTTTTTTTPVPTRDLPHERPRLVWDQRGNSTSLISLTFPTYQMEGITHLEEGNAAGLPRDHSYLDSTNSMK